MHLMSKMLKLKLVVAVLCIINYSEFRIQKCFNKLNQIEFRYNKLCKVNEIPMNLKQSTLIKRKYNTYTFSMKLTHDFRLSLSKRKTQAKIIINNVSTLYTCFLILIKLNKYSIQLVTL